MKIYSQISRIARSCVAKLVVNNLSFFYCKLSPWKCHLCQKVDLFPFLTEKLLCRTVTLREIDGTRAFREFCCNLWLPWHCQPSSLLLLLNISVYTCIFIFQNLLLISLTCNSLWQHFAVKLCIIIIFHLIFV